MSANTGKPQSGDTLVYFDIEGLPCEEQDPLWQELSLRCEQPSIALPQTSLTPMLGRVWMIGAAVGRGDPQLFSGNGTPEEEEGVLIEFQSLLLKLDNPWLVGFNIKRFDIPFLQVRALKYGLTSLAKMLGSPIQKPWERRVLDCYELWPAMRAPESLRQAGLTKMDTVCAYLGIPRQTGIMGGDIYQAYLDGNRQGAEDHLREDVIQTREVFRRLFPLM